MVRKVKNNNKNKKYGWLGLIAMTVIAFGALYHFLHHASIFQSSSDKAVFPVPLETPAPANPTTN